MWQFVKFSLATVVGIFLFLLFGLLITVGIGSAMSGDTEYEVKENSILKLDLNRPLVEAFIQMLSGVVYGTRRCVYFAFAACDYFRF